MIAYETQLNQDLRWALQEGSMHFEEASAVHRTLRRVVKRLDELGVPYAVAGGMALFLHGFRRFTEDVDILVTKDGLRLIHEQLEGLGYVAPFQGSKNLRDADTGVRIEFLVTGEYPGDGKPKPVAFPDPAAVGVERDGVRDGDRGEEVPALAQPLPQQPAPNAAILQGVEWVEPLQAEGRDIVPGAVNNRDHRPSRFAPHDLPPSAAPTDITDRAGVPPRRPRRVGRRRPSGRVALVLEIHDEQVVGRRGIVDYKGEAVQ